MKTTTAADIAKLFELGLIDRDEARLALSRLGVHLAPRERPFGIWEIVSAISWGHNLTETEAEQMAERFASLNDEDVTAILELRQRSYQRWNAAREAEKSAAPPVQ